MPGLALLLEDDLDDFPAYQPTRAIGRALTKLDEIADEIGSTRLSDFLSGEAEAERFGRQVLDEIAEHEGWSDYRSGRERPTDAWFEADDGLEAVRALVNYLESDPEVLKRPEAVLKELALVEDTLSDAAAQAVRFRFEQDD